eukprot:TRINITY_DN3284_c0_g1_i2.p1 TRINITY_DN3284_c0_g1~~TRINITY_DN3284_c0_g1_i2.p1  ORF type:complete len:119 (+),score=53.32 TRINITY_DN3284_c0_g1_i2:45-359(+)
MADHNYVLSPWQIYCGLFVMFWASQWYFSSFWMTILCCLKFGLIAELVTDYMYKRGRVQEEGHGRGQQQAHLPDGDGQGGGSPGAKLDRDGKAGGVTKNPTPPG